jgi:hypothetical protein
MQTLRVVAAQAVSVPRKGTVDLSDEKSWSDDIITTCFARELQNYELNRCAVGVCVYVCVCVCVRVSTCICVNARVFVCVCP